MAKRSKRVYQGRFKGSTETHMPNDTFKSKYDVMEWDSFVPVDCQCGYTSYRHKLDKIYRCPNCGEIPDE